MRLHPGNLPIQIRRIRRHRPHRSGSCRRNRNHPQQSHTTHCWSMLPPDRSYTRPRCHTLRRTRNRKYRRCSWQLGHSYRHLKLYNQSTSKNRHPPSLEACMNPPRDLYIQRFRVRCTRHLRPRRSSSCRRNRGSSIPGTHTNHCPRSPLHRSCTLQHPYIQRRSCNHTVTHRGNRLTRQSCTQSRPYILPPSSCRRPRSHQRRILGFQDRCNPILPIHRTFRHRLHRSGSCRHNRTLLLGIHMNHCPAYCRLRSYTRLHLYNLRMK